MGQEMPYLQQVRNTANVSLDVILANMDANSATALAVAVAALNGASTANGAGGNALSVAQAAYGQGNTALSVAEAAYAAANAAGSSGSSAGSGASNALAVAQAAYGQANSATSTATTALNNAGAAYSTANSAISNSGVTNGSYGSPIIIPTFSVDARGRITSVTPQTVQTFSSGQAGVVPASGGGTSNFLRADGSWAAPAGIASGNVVEEGYVVFSNGLMMQWGRFTTSGGSTSVSFPTTFPSACFVVCITASGLTGAEYTNGYPSQSGFTCINQSSNIPMQYIAIGH